MFMEETIANPTIIKQILKRYDIQLNKGLGQNFLIDKNIHSKIITAAELELDDNVIEIGAGIGSLTQQILKNLSTGRLITIEKDNRFIEVLEEIFRHNQVEIINQDVLEINWDKFLKKMQFTEKPLKIMGNLPYYITTPIIFNLLEADLNISKMIFMVQKEVAERMVAGPGGKDFGSLSVAVQFYSQPEIVYDVSPNVFMPQPRVWSSIVSIEPYSKSPYQVNNKEFFFKIVKAIFQLRRKTIKNSLTKASVINLEKETVLKGLKECGIDSRIRGEKLEIARMVKLSNILWNYREEVK